MRPRARASGVTLGLVALLSTAVAAAWVPYRTGTGEPIYWWSDPLDYYIDTNLPEGFDPDRVEKIFDAAFRAWTEFECHPTSVERLGWVDDAPLSTDDEVNHMVWIHDPDVWTQQWSATMAAVTVIHFDPQTGALEDTDMAFNVSKGFIDNLTCDPDAPYFDLLSVVTHEAGHYFGLDHSDDVAATMNQFTFTGDCKKRTLAQDDQDGFCYLYTLEPPEPPPEEGPEAGPEADPERSPEAAPEATRGAPDDCAAGSQGGGLWAAWIAALALLTRRRRQHA